MGFLWTFTIRYYFAHWDQYSTYCSCIEIVSISSENLKGLNSCNWIVYVYSRHENFPEFRNFPDHRGHSCGNPRSGLIFMGGGGGVVVGTIHCVYFATQSLIIVCIHHSFNQFWNNYNIAYTIRSISNRVD